MIIFQILLLLSGLISLFFLVRWRSLVARQRRGRFVSPAQRKIPLVFCLLSFVIFLGCLAILIADWAQQPSGPDEGLSSGSSVFRMPK